MRRRRRDLKVERISSEAIEAQGEGTWVEVRRKLTFQHLRPVIELAAWAEDPRVKGEQGQQAMVEAMSEMMDGFGVALFPLILAWNWVTDMEAELAGAPDVAGERVRLRLESPIWAGSDYRTIGDDGAMGPPPFVIKQPVYIGNYPEDYQRLDYAGMSDDGRMLVLDGELSREYEPGAHYVIVGLPDPDSPEAFGWLGLEELMWLVDQLSQRFKTEMKRQEGREHPNPVAST